MESETRPVRTLNGLSDAFDSSARTFRRLVHQAIGGEDVRHDLRMAERSLEELMGQAREIVRRHCGEIEDADAGE
mgnify:CR=1 FL=1